MKTLLAETELELQIIIALLWKFHSMSVPTETSKSKVICEITCWELGMVKFRMYFKLQKDTTIAAVNITAVDKPYPGTH